jgi:hypothetical protein
MMNLHTVNGSSLELERVDERVPRFLLLHCHNLEREDIGMTLSSEVIQ